MIGRVEGPANIMISFQATKTHTCIAATITKRAAAVVSTIVTLIAGALSLPDRARTRAAGRCGDTGRTGWTLARRSASPEGHHGLHSGLWYLEFSIWYMVFGAGPFTNLFWYQVLSDILPRDQVAMG